MTNCSFNSKTVREWSWVSLDERWTLVPSGLGFSLMMIILRSVTQRDYQRNKSCDKVLISATEVGVCSCVCVCVYSHMWCMYSVVFSSCFRVAGFGCSCYEVNDRLAVTENKRCFVVWQAFLSHGDSLGHDLTLTSVTVFVCSFWTSSSL